MLSEFTIRTTKRQELVDITAEVKAIADKSKIDKGIVNVYVPHATAAVAINENADPSVRDDIIDALNKLIKQGIWKHDRIDGNADAHIKAAMVGPSETMPINDGRLQLGTWQSIFFCEFDGPRSSRRIIISVVKD